MDTAVVIQSESVNPTSLGMAEAALRNETHDYFKGSSNSEDEASKVIVKEKKRIEKNQPNNYQDSKTKQKDKTKINAEDILRRETQKFNSQTKQPTKKRAQNDAGKNQKKGQKKSISNTDDSYSSSSDEDDKGNNQAKGEKEFKQNAIKQRLREGIKKQDTQMLKRAMKDAEMVGMKKNEKYLVMARDTVKALEERNKLRAAVKKAKAEAIKNEIDVITRNLSFFVSHCPGIQREVPWSLEVRFAMWQLPSGAKLPLIHRKRHHRLLDLFAFLLVLGVFEAQRQLEDIERSKKREREVSVVINQGTMSAIKGFKEPPTKVHRVMQGSFLLLGYDLDKTSEWRFITSKCNGSTLKGILDFDVSQLHPDIAATAQKVLREQNRKNLYSISEAAMSFYVWGMGTADECQKLKGKGKVIGVKRQNEIFSKKLTENEDQSSASSTADDKKIQDDTVSQDNRSDQNLANSQEKFDQK
ncbi:hypothetical protein LSH36_62g07012 [Paralvinella palmiformis]|uniref:Uncharacterized protein n=1 Tax=Paralvinella palmiformis TaxID=53620 RepID=A0AAD9K451_9ANNE|nr:hypothetical protein LSH36_62g07012 [Paralvinella palmiformis]